MELLVIEFWARSEIVLMCLCWLAWTGHRVLIRLMALMLINLWYLLILVKNCAGGICGATAGTTGGATIGTGAFMGSGGS